MNIREFINSAFSNNFISILQNDSGDKISSLFRLFKNLINENIDLNLKASNYYDTIIFFSKDQYNTIEDSLKKIDIYNKFNLTYQKDKKIFYLSVKN